MTGNSGATAQDKTWQGKEQGDEARYIREKEHAQLAAVREQADKAGDGTTNTAAKSDIEGGFGGLEDYEDRYATTSGEH